MTDSRTKMMSSQSQRPRSVRNTNYLGLRCAATIEISVQMRIRTNWFEPTRSRIVQGWVTANNEQIFFYLSLSTSSRRQQSDQAGLRRYWRPFKTRALVAIIELSEASASLKFQGFWVRKS